jgi:hypothetical protein
VRLLTSRSGDRNSLEAFCVIGIITQNYWGCWGEIFRNTFLRTWGEIFRTTWGHLEIYYYLFGGGGPGDLGVLTRSFKLFTGSLFGVFENPVDIFRNSIVYSISSTNPPMLNINSMFSNALLYALL